MSILSHEKQLVEYEETITQLKKGEGQERLLSSAEIRRLDKKLEKYKEKVYSNLSAHERVQISRHPRRPRTTDYIEALCQDFMELSGDRTFRNDPAVVGGLGHIDGQKYMIIGQEKGSDTESRLHRNFGMCHPEGFRKALRLMQMAGKFQIPILSIIDTPGAYCGLTAEERGQGWVIAMNLREMVRVPVPIIVVVIGEAGSGGALAMAVGDQIGMMEHAYYAVISPEGCASILWKDAAKKEQAATALKLNAENLYEYGVVDTVIKEPLGGAHHDPKIAFENVQTFIKTSYHKLKDLPTSKLLDERYERYRKLGEYQAE